MKVIDQTPLFKENGELSIIDRGKAMAKYGSGWIKEIEAQKAVLPILDKVLDRSYTLLRNVTPPELGIQIPFILVGPTGVFVMYITHLIGMYRARGDQWGKISGNMFKAENPNMLTRTERMARAVEVYLQRQGYVDLPPVEAILLCADPGSNVDSLRPIVRVVLRDALERLAVSITQARVVLSPEAVQKIVGHILNPPQAAPPTPEEPVKEGIPLEAKQEEDLYIPAFALPEAESEFTTPTFPFEVPEALDSAPFQVPEPVPSFRHRARRRRGLTGKQWAFLIGMFVVWCLIFAVFIYLVARDQSMLGIVP